MKTHETDLFRAVWRKASYSNGGGGDCVEIADMEGGNHLVRDSKHVAGPVLVVSRSEWVVFVASIRSGDFD